MIVSDLQEIFHIETLGNFAIPNRNEQTLKSAAPDNTKINRIIQQDLIEMSLPTGLRTGNWRQLKK